MAGTLVKKECRRCHQRKATATQFYRSKDNPDGFRQYCKDCGKALTKKYAANKGSKSGAKAKKAAKRKPVARKAPARKPTPEFLAALA